MKAEYPLSVGSWIYLLVAGAVAVVGAVRGVWSPCGLSMLSSINPLTERSRGHRFWVTALWFIAGSVAGGAALGGAAAVGAILWALIELTVSGPVVLSASAAMVCALLAIASDSKSFSWRLPTHPRQVNEQWLGRYRRWVYASGFGFQIGTGFATYIMTAAVYLTAALGVLTGSPLLALLIGLLFGLLRGAAILLSVGGTDAARLLSLQRRLDSLAPASLRAAVSVEAIAVVVFGFLALGVPGVVLSSLVLYAGWRWGKSHLRSGASSEKSVGPSHRSPAERGAAALEVAKAVDATR